MGHRSSPKRQPPFQLSPGQTAQATPRALHVGTLVTMPRMLLRHTNRQIKTKSQAREMAQQVQTHQSLEEKKELRLLKVCLLTSTHNTQVVVCVHLYARACTRACAHTHTYTHSAEGLLSGERCRNMVLSSTSKSGSG